MWWFPPRGPHEYGASSAGRARCDNEGSTNGRRPVLGGRPGCKQGVAGTTEGTPFMQAVQDSSVANPFGQPIGSGGSIRAAGGEPVAPGTLGPPAVNDTILAGPVALSFTGSPNGGTRSRRGAWQAAMSSPSTPSTWPVPAGASSSSSISWRSWTSTSPTRRRWKARSTRPCSSSPRLRRHRRRLIRPRPPRPSSASWRTPRTPSSTASTR